MALVTVSDSSLTAIADAIREQLDTEDTYKPSEMAGAIGEIGSATLGTKTITSNGTYDAEDDSLDGYSEVTVNVSGGVTPTGTKQISITENGTTTEDVTNYADAEITVNVPSSGGWTEGETGELTPSSTVTMITVPVSKTYTNFAIFVKDSTSDMIKTATRNLVMAKGTYDYIQIMDCNASGSSNSFNRARTSNNYITFTSTSITATFLGNGAFASLCAGQAYRWFAW